MLTPVPRKNDGAPQLDNIDHYTKSLQPSLTSKSSQIIAVLFVVLPKSYQYFA